MQDLSDVTLQTATLSLTPSGESDQPMYCTDCGTKNTNDANFCKQCGHKLVKTGPLKISEEEFALPPSKDDRYRDLLLLAFKHYEAGDIQQAVLACEEAIGLKPESTDAHSLLSTLYERRGLTELAVAERQKVLALNPGSIADREKLDQLRDGTMEITPRKITSYHRAPRGSALDNPGGAAAAAVVVMLLVLMGGAWAVWASKTRQAEARSRGANVSQLPAGVSNPQTFAQNPAAFNTTQFPTQQRLASPQPGAVYFPPQNTQQNTQAYDPPPTQRSSLRRDRGLPGMEENNFRGVPPAAVRPPNTSPQERYTGLPVGGSRIGGNQTGAGTVHLPDSQGVEINQASNGAGSGQTTRTPGKIEIVVSPGGEQKNTGSTSKSGGDDAGSSMDSRDQRRAALRYQSEGNYRMALTSWIKSLDGAGDDAADIHQHIALCHQRLDDKESAVEQYKAAISAYKQLISAGRNVEAAKRGVKACEAGIKACQS
jgi:tetratricopeptide (TPR) repeat protein